MIYIYKILKRLFIFLFLRANQLKTIQNMHMQSLQSPPIQGLFF